MPGIITKCFLCACFSFVLVPFHWVDFSQRDSSFDMGISSEKKAENQWIWKYRFLFFPFGFLNICSKVYPRAEKKTEAALFMWKIFHSVLYPFGLFQNCRHLSENTNICICTTHDNAKHSIRLFSVWHSKNAHFFNILLWSFSVCFFFQSFVQSVLYFVQCYTHDQMIHIFCQTTHFVQLSVANTKSVRNHCRSNCRK